MRASLRETEGEGEPAVRVLEKPDDASAFEGLSAYP